jgi:hypothetical protein
MSYAEEIGAVRGTDALLRVGARCLSHSIRILMSRHGYKADTIREEKDLECGRNPDTLSHESYPTSPDKQGYWDQFFPFSFHLGVRALFVLEAG